MTGSSALNTLVTRYLVLVVGLLLLCRNVDAPYQWNGAIYNHFARNHLEYGFGYTRFYCTWGETNEPPPEPQRYLNHPPLIAVWAAIPMAILGEEEWVGRSVPIAAALGSAFLLMVMLTRLHSARLATLAGLFYVSLPITAFYGRMPDQTAPTQFFSLLMLHGYLLRTGVYSTGRRSSAGVICYGLAAILGVGTGWGVLIMAGLVWAWHAIRVVRGAGQKSLLFWLAAIPGMALLAVVLHILWARDWDGSMFGPLLWTRTFGASGTDAKPWIEWLGLQRRFISDNFTWFGMAAVLLFLLGYLARRVTAVGYSGLGRPTPGASGRLPVYALLGLDGLLYVGLFKNQSWTHDYWQFLLAPFVALAMASFVVGVYAVIAAWSPRWAVFVALVIALIPIPSLARSLDRYHHRQQMPARYIEAFEKLAGLTPGRSPVMTSHAWPHYSESLGSYTNRWMIPQVAFYANRPLIHTLSVDEVIRNEPTCSAYLLDFADDPQVYALARFLMENYETVPVGQHHLIAFLERPQVRNE